MIVPGTLERSDPGRVPGPLLRMIQTRNRHLVTLAEEVWYVRNTFHLSFYDLSMATVGLLRPSLSKVHMIRNIVYYMDQQSVPQSLGVMFRARHSPWTFLLRPIEKEGMSPKSTPLTLWQDSFTDLEHIRLVISLGKTTYINSRGNKAHGMLDRMRATLAGVGSGLKAKEVTVEVRYPVRRQKREEVNKRTKKIEEVFEKMMTK